ncbi:hypothetical protein DV515_00007656 [Chloebia gouldiae]|uniref:Uncharacterized protein n=1 Tax=Chloebia gouldiae TaxID=44316 RepID=A0A3L8SH88_CHLGU|nr:hypothetical protein DV515_00007656 [Chloebia gouldiae]
MGKMAVRTSSLCVRLPERDPRPDPALSARFSAAFPAVGHGMGTQDGDTGCGASAAGSSSRVRLLSEVRLAAGAAGRLGRAGTRDEGLAALGVFLSPGAAGMTAGSSRRTGGPIKS